MRTIRSPRAPVTRPRLVLRAARDPRLRQLARREAGQQPEPLAGLLRDVVATAAGSPR